MSWPEHEQERILARKMTTLFLSAIVGQKIELQANYIILEAHKKYLRTYGKSMRNSNSLEIKYTDFKPGLLPATYIHNRK